MYLFPRLLLRVSCFQPVSSSARIRSKKVLWNSAVRALVTMAEVSPFTKTVVESMRHLYPESLADKSFDNTGLLLEAPISPHSPRKSNSILLTIDLTRAVAEEAIQDNHAVVVAYHPIIFRGLKAITLEDSQQSTLLRLASHGITVYSPHTAVDIVPNGMGDWLCDIVTGKIDPGPEKQAISATSKEDSIPAPPPILGTDNASSADEEGKTQPAGKGADEPSNGYSTPKSRPEERPKMVHRTYSKPSYPSQNTSSPIRTADNVTFYPSSIPHKRSVIVPSPSSAIETANSSFQQNQNESSTTSTSQPYSAADTGAGRVITFDEPQPLATLITRIANATGQPKGFPVAIPQWSPLESIRIRTVGVCPGSGSSVIRNCQPPPDLVFTGEMSHHEALAVIERGGSVITLFHSNSERGYLERVMRSKIEEEVKQRWRKIREDQARQHPQQEGKLSHIVKETLADDSVKVAVSRRDRDPFGIVVLQESQAEGQVI